MALSLTAILSIIFMVVNLQKGSRIMDMQSGIFDTKTLLAIVARERYEKLVTNLKN